MVAGACKTTMEEQEQKAMSDEYQSQPLHVRAKAEKWIIARSEIHIGTLLGEGQQGQVHHASPPSCPPSDFHCLYLL